jgi:hypothetical protein
LIPKSFLGFKQNEKYKTIKLLITKMKYYFNQNLKYLSMVLKFFFLRAILTRVVSEIPEINPEANRIVFYQGSYLL